MASPELNIDEQNPSNNGQTVDEFYSVFLKDEHPWTPDLVSVVSLAATYKNKTRLEDSSSTTNGIEIAAAQWDFTTDLGLRYTGFADHLIQAGVQGGYVHNFDTYAIVSYPPSLIIPKTTLVGADSQSVGFYADDEYRVTKWLKLVGGVRVDHNNVLRNGCWYPGARAAIIVEPTTHWVSKLTYNRAARMPTALESPLNEAWGKDRSGTPSFATNPNANQPEILTTYEWQNIVYLGPARLGATVYHQELEDFISWFNPWTNIGNLRGNGVELNVQAQLGSRCQIWANGSWNDSTLHPFYSGLFRETQRHLSREFAWPDHRRTGIYGQCGIGFRDHQEPDGFTRRALLYRAGGVGRSGQPADHPQSRLRRCHGPVAKLEKQQGDRDGRAPVRLQPRR